VCCSVRKRSKCCLQGTIVAVPCSALQCVAECNHVLQRIAACCGVLHFAQMKQVLIAGYETTCVILINLWCRGHILQHTATHCNTMQYNATQCNTLQHTATQCITFNTLQHKATQSNTKQHKATQSNTLQHNATQLDTLQHTATHCNTLQHTTCHVKNE